ncbi:MAG: hypothetical protein ACFE0Q_21255 [Anaerolineae bacterium]
MSTRKRRDQLDNNFFDGDFDDSLPELNIKEVDEVGFGGLALPNVRQDGDVVKLGAFHISMKGLQIQGRITQDEWWAFFDGVQKIENAIQFIIGDLANYGEEAFQISYETIAEHTGYKVETVENYAYVARNVSRELRNEALSFNHHYLVASLENDDEKARWLGKAETHELSVRNLELALNIWRDGGDPQRVFDVTDDSPSPVQAARLKMVRERMKVMKKARGKNGRKLWLTYAKEQAAEWQELVDKINRIDDSE